MQRVSMRTCSVMPTKTDDKSELAHNRMVATGQAELQAAHLATGQSVLAVVPYVRSEKPALIADRFCPLQPIGDILQQFAIEPHILIARRK